MITATESSASQPLVRSLKGLFRSPDGVPHHHRTSASAASWSHGFPQLSTPKDFCRSSGGPPKGRPKPPLSALRAAPRRGPRLLQQRARGGGRPVCDPWKVRAASCEAVEDRDTSETPRLDRAALAFRERPAACLPGEGRSESRASAAVPGQSRGVGAEQTAPPPTSPAGRRPERAQGAGPEEGAGWHVNSRGQEDGTPGGGGGPGGNDRVQLAGSQQQAAGGAAPGRHSASCGPKKKRSRGNERGRASPETLRRLERAKDVGAVGEALEGQPVGGRHVMAVLCALDAPHHRRCALLVWQWWQTHPQYRPDVRLYTKMMSLLGRGKAHTATWQLLARMREEGCTPDAAPFNVLISALGRRGQADAALRVFAEMRRVGPAGASTCTPTVVTYGALVMTLARARRLGEARALLGEMARALLRPNAVIFNTLVAAHARAGDCAGMDAMVAEMRAHGIAPTAETYTALIAAYGARGAHGLVVGTWQEAERTLGGPPDVALFTALVGALGRSRRFDLVDAALTKMRAAGVRADAVLFGTVMHALACAGELERMEACVASMARHDGLVPNAVVFNILLQAYGRQGQVAAMERTLDRMAAARVPPDRATFEILLLAYRQAGQTGHMEQVVWRMRGAGYTLRTHAWNALLEAYADAGMLQKMEDTWRLMESCSHNGGGRGRGGGGRRAASACAPNSKTFAVLAQAYEHAHLWGRADHFHGKILNRLKSGKIGTLVRSEGVGEGNEDDGVLRSGEEAGVGDWGGKWGEEEDEDGDKDSDADSDSDMVSVGAVDAARLSLLSGGPESREVPLVSKAAASPLPPPS